MQEIKNVAVIGAGTMGNGIAHVFAQHGCKVNLIDVSEKQLAKAMETIGPKTLTGNLPKAALMRR
jgi:3-hydroxybutyryl-CoA dehydrogenase